MGHRNAIQRNALPPLVTEGVLPLRQEVSVRRQGDIVLAILRLTLLACCAALVGTLGMVAWNIVTG